MKLINFIIWLSAGAVIGWIASRMVRLESPQKPVTLEVRSSEED
jgi:hypothetical protein